MAQRCAQMLRCWLSEGARVLHDYNYILLYKYTVKGEIIAKAK